MTETRTHGGLGRPALADVVAQVWCEVLHVDLVDRDTDFFALGGNSLQGARVIGRLREEIGASIPMRLLFGGQTVTGLADEIDRFHDSVHADAPTIEPIPRHGSGTFEAPTSFAQRRLWVEEQIQGPSATYTVPFAGEIEGSVDVDALRAAVAGLVERHEVFRTGFRPVGGVPVQVVVPVVPVPFAVSDFTHLPMAQAEQAVADHLAAAARRPFVIEQPPLLRVELLRVEPEFSVLLLAMHHLVTDGRSFDLVLAELLDSYASHGADDRVPIPSPTVQYADFAAWQQNTIDQASFDTQVDYWRTQLKGPPPVLDLAADLVARPQRTGAGATESIELPRALSREIRALSRRLAVTPFMTVVAAFSTVLHRYTGQTDIVIGTPAASRDMAELTDMLGFLVNTLALRCDLSGDPVFADLLARVRAVALDAFAHQDVPFERVLNVVAPGRAGGDRLFSVMLAFQQETRQPAVPGIEVTPLELGTGTAKFDLGLMVTESEAGYRLAVEYRTDLFRPETARGLLDHLRVTLRSAVAAPDSRLSDLPMMPAAERELIESWSESAHGPYPAGETMHGMVEAQVRRTPDAIALQDGDVRLTFAELDRRADALAVTLAGLGAGPERFVGLCAGPSADLVIGILGILKSGAAYVPVDPLAPAERIRHVLSDSGLQVMVTTTALRDALPLDGTTVVCVDEDHSGRDVGVPVPVTADHLAYLIYTSGSTGRPKGVAVTHGQVTPLLHWLRAETPLGAGDRVLQCLAPFFDASIQEMFHSLVCGACLVVCPASVKADPQATAAFVNEHGITVGYFPPSQLEGLVGAGVPMPGLRRLFFGGEQLPADLADRTRQLVSAKCEMWNCYGPTECAVTVAAGPANPADGRRSVPLGGPVANGTCRVVDDRGNPVPVGVPGELWLGGDGVARGYHARPDLTAERFVPDPVHPGRRVYRSGDRARWLPDGRLEFLGRLDQQVKIRGVRVELGEVESVLREHGSVTDAVVSFDEPARLLIAYVVAEAFDEAELRAYLARELPGNLQPSMLLALLAIPRTGSGKVDRQALAGPASIPQVRPPSREFASDAERAVAEVWAQHLGHNDFTPETNFFAAGGDSLSLLAVVEALARRFEVEVQVRTLIDTPTIAGLAAGIELLQWTLRSQRIGLDTSGPREVGEL